MRCCPQYPTETCVMGNRGVRSARDNVASSCTDGGHDREAKAATPSIQGVGDLSETLALGASAASG